MITVGADEAKALLSELLDCVVAGEKVKITRHGEEIALLIPAQRRATSGEDFAVRMARWRQTRHGVKLKGLSVRKMIRKGRQ